MRSALSHFAAFAWGATCAVIWIALTDWWDERETARRAALVSG